MKTSAFDVQISLILLAPESQIRVLCGLLSITAGCVLPTGDCLLLTAFRSLLPPNHHLDPVRVPTLQY